MNKKVLSLVSAFITLSLFSSTCFAETDFSDNQKAAYDYDDFDYNDHYDYFDESEGDIDYEPSWDLGFEYLGTFHDRDSGFSAEIFQGGAIITSCDRNDIHLVIPEKMGDKTVIAIGENAFRGNQSITDVKLPKGLKYIGEYAFGNCISLRSVEFPDSLFSIEKRAFYKCALESAQFPDSLHSIGMEAFLECKNLKSAAFSDSIERICSYAFKNSGIEWANLPNNLKYLGKGAFENCLKLKVVNFATCPEIIRGYTFSNCEKLGGVTLTKGLAVIEENAFYNSGLTSVEFHEGLTGISSQAFMNCKQLTEVVFPQSLQTITIGESAFEKCEALEKIKLPLSLTEIPTSAFSYCSSLKSVTIPEGVKKIGYEAFAWCEALEEIYIPDSVINISPYAFRMEDTSKITIKGSYDSAARRFAERNDISFKIDTDENQQIVALTVITCVWAAVLIVCVALLIKAGIGKKAKIDIPQ